LSLLIILFKILPANAQQELGGTARMITYAHITFFLAPGISLGTDMFPSLKGQMLNTGLRMDRVWTLSDKGPRAKCRPHTPVGM